MGYNYDRSLQRMLWFVVIAGLGLLFIMGDLAVGLMTGSINSGLPGWPVGVGFSLMIVGLSGLFIGFIWEAFHDR